MNARQTKTVTAIIRQIVGQDPILYNERLVNGDRSVKVGQQHPNSPVISSTVNEAIKFALWTAGFKVTENRTRGGKIRLHVAVGVAG